MKVKVTEDYGKWQVDVFPNDPVEITADFSGFLMPGGIATIVQRNSNDYGDTRDDCIWMPLDDAYELCSAFVKEYEARKNAECCVKKFDEEAE